MGQWVHTLFFLALLGLAGCDNACDVLNSRICACQPTDTDRQSCKQRVTAAKRLVTLSPEDKERCEVLLDTCNCERLAEGDLAACGLSEESGQ
ncbi:MAG: hypothetical protein R3C68_15895 [Myxococcota bacterium]